MLSKEEYQNIMNTLNQIKEALNASSAKSKNEILDNADMFKLLKISRRTLQNWRDTGIISFSKVDGKIFYRYSDVEELLKNNYCKAFLPTKKPFSFS